MDRPPQSAFNVSLIRCNLKGVHCSQRFGMFHVKRVAPWACHRRPETWACQRRPENGYAPELNVERRQPLNMGSSAQYQAGSERNRWVQARRPDHTGLPRLHGISVAIVACRGPNPVCQCDANSVVPFISREEERGRTLHPVLQPRPRLLKRQ